MFRIRIKYHLSSLFDLLISQSSTKSKTPLRQKCKHTASTATILSTPPGPHQSFSLIVGLEIYIRVTCNSSLFLLWNTLLRFPKLPDSRPSIPSLQ